MLSRRISNGVEKLTVGIDGNLCVLTGINLEKSEICPCLDLVYSLFRTGLVLS